MRVQERVSVGWLAVLVVAAGTVALVLTLTLARHESRPAAGPAVNTQVASGLSPGDGTATTLDMVSDASGWVWGPVFVGRTSNGLASVADVTPSAIQRMGGGQHVGLASDAHHLWLANPLLSTTGARAKILETADGGSSWTLSTLTLAPGLWIQNPAIASIAASSNTDVWVEIDYVQQAGDYGHFLVGTTDGGATWHTLTQTIAQLPPSAPPAPAGATSSASGIPSNCHVAGLHFRSATNGYLTAMCSGNNFILLATHDGGATWAAPATLPWASERANLYATSGGGNDIGSDHYVLALATRGSSCRGSRTTLYASSDAVNWSATGTAPIAGRALFGATANHLLLIPSCIGDAVPLITSDSGQHWTPFASLPSQLLRSSASLHSLQVVSDSSVFGLTSDVVSRVTTYYASNDGGLTFRSVNSTGGNASPSRSP